MDNSTGDKLQSEFVIWRHLDIFVSVFAFFSGMYFWGYSHYKPVGCLSILFLIGLLFCGKLYLREKKRPLWFRVGSGILRAVLYLAVAVGLLFCMMSTWDVKGVYGIQRDIFLSNFTEQDVAEFMPETLPEEAHNYLFDMGCAPNNAISKIGMSFFTDSATVAEYKARAEKMGMSPDNKPTEDYNSNWEYSLKTAGVDPEKAEYLYAPDATENYPKVYIIEEESGFIKLYY